MQGRSRMNTPTLNTRRLTLPFRWLCLRSAEFLPWFPLKNLDEAKSFYQERYASIYQKKQRYAYAIC